MWVWIGWIGEHSAVSFPRRVMIHGLGPDIVAGLGRNSMRTSALYVSVREYVFCKWEISNVQIGLEQKGTGSMIWD